MLNNQKKNRLSHSVFIQPTWLLQGLKLDAGKNQMTIRIQLAHHHRLFMLFLLPRVSVATTTTATIVVVVVLADRPNVLVASWRQAEGHTQVCLHYFVFFFNVISSDSFLFISSFYIYPFFCPALNTLANERTHSFTQTYAWIRTHQSNTLSITQTQLKKCGSRW